MKEKPFLYCRRCGASWATRAEFLLDPALEYLGFQVDLRHAESGLLMFNHDCQSTVSVTVDDMRELVEDGIEAHEDCIGIGGCPGFCLNMGEILDCKVECKRRLARQIIARIHELKNTPIGRQIES